MPIDRDSYREQSLARGPRWPRLGGPPRVADGYDRTVSDWLLGKLDPRVGQTILEIAAGTGDLGLRGGETCRRIRAA